MENAMNTFDRLVWDTPSQGPEDSMPCGGGDIGLNVWVQDGEVLFYLARDGAFDENNTMLKLGRVRLRLTPNPFTESAEFRQELRLRDGSVWITGTNGTKIHIWVEVARPVIHVNIETSVPTAFMASYENWRTQDRPLEQEERFQCLSFLRTTQEQFPVITYADVFDPKKDAILWYHRNKNEDLVFDKEVTQQHLSDVRDEFWNPQENLTFGGIMRGVNLGYDGTSHGSFLGTDFTAWTLKSLVPAPSHSLTIALHTEQTETVSDWKANLLRLADTYEPTEQEAQQQNESWWAHFWDRSHIVLQPDTDDPDDPIWQLGRNAQLFRYLLACNAYGEYPSKFNGSLFTWDAPPFTPDFRKWGGGSFTAQNQRLLYWPLLKSGDFDLMIPQFEFYRRALGNAELRTRVYWGHGGASFTEQIENFGLPVGEIYEQNWGGHGLGPRPGAEPGELLNAWCEDLYDTVLEFCLMILDVERFTGEDISRFLPLIESSATFFDEHYQYELQQRTGQRLDAQGRLVIFPGTACETYKKATNASSTVAGLRVVLSRLLELPETYGSPDQRDYWAAFLNRVPQIPMRDRDGHVTISPAETWERISNEEFPQMYPIFPFGLYGLGRPDLQIALNTWHYGADEPKQRGMIGWKQDAIFCARLGLMAEARDLVAAKLSNAPRRFPACWGPNFDWTPDLNHGGSALIALQEMLMQTPGPQIILLPAWPPKWDVDFKLHAPYKTLVQGRVRGGQLIALSITPEERRADVRLGPELAALPAEIPVLTSAPAIR
jgi:hypothetical protein